MFKIKGKKKGFTLIELIVVIAVLAILVTIGVPRFLGHTKDAEVATMKADTKIVEQAAYQYALNNDDQWPILADETVNITWTKSGKTLEGLAGDDAKAYKIDFTKINQYIRSLSVENPEGQFVLILGGDADYEGIVMTVNEFQDGSGNIYSGLELLKKAE